MYMKVFLQEHFSQTALVFLQERCGNLPACL